jgi:outer membrane protein assembly complex protein YaeT
MLPMRTSTRLRAAATASVVLTLLAVSGCREEGGVRVTSFRFTGNEAVDADQLLAVLATGQSSRLPWGEQRYFSREQFEADLKRIAAFYQDRGYPDAQVRSFDVSLSRNQDAVAITVDIAEGEPIVVERLELAGFEELRPWALRNLESRLPLTEGQPMDRALLQASREAALDQLREQGYPYASVRMTEGPGTTPRGRVVSLMADTGPLARHGPIEILGNATVSDTVIQRQLAYRPGEVFRQSRIVESQRRLYGLEVFQFAHVQPVREEGEQPVEIPTRVTVTEGPPRRVNFSLGYGSEERARGEIDWRHVNFMGGARTAGVRGRYSSLDRGVRLNFTEPYFLTPRHSFSLQGQSWFSNEPAFTLTTLGGRATVTRQFGAFGADASRWRRATTSLSLTYANEWEEYSISDEALSDLTFRDRLIALGLDPRTGTGRGQRSALIIDAGRNTTDSILDARRGYFASIHLEQAGSWLGGDFSYYETTGEGRYYLRLGNAAVVALRARAGSIDAIRGEVDVEGAVPFYKRYFLGGATNLRGWGRFQVSPLSGAGLPIGGHTFANFSTEVRFPVWNQLSGVLFLDGGNVWADPWDFKLNDLRYNVGPGLRYNTPIGPVRVDLGYQLNPIPGLLVNGDLEPRRFRFHISIGQAF